MSHHRRSPRQIGDALVRLRRTWEPDTLLAEIQAIWPQSVGEVIAVEAEPVTVHGGVLTVVCSGSVWAQELDLMAPAILERLNRDLSRGRLRSLRCRSTR